MHNNTRNVLLTLTALTGIGLPLAGHALAQGKAPAVQVVQTQNSQTNDTETDDDQSSAVHGSIQLPAAVPDVQEQAQYRALAKITPGQAQQAALAAVPSTVTNVKLEEEHGSLVYSVVIGSTEVKVDAGTGQVLQQETADQEQGGEQESDETGENNN